MADTFTPIVARGITSADISQTWTTDQALPLVEVSPSAVTFDQLAAAARQAALVVGAIGAVLGLAQTRDIAGLVAWLQSSEAATAGAAALALGSLAWGQWKVRHRAKQVVAVAASPIVPEAVARLGPSTPA